MSDEDLMDKLRTRMYEEFFKHPFLPWQFDPTESMDTYALLGIHFDVMYTNKDMLDQFGLIAVEIPDGWRKVRGAPGTFAFQLVDGEGTAVVEGRVHAGPFEYRQSKNAVHMRLTAEGRRLAKERWAQLSWWRRRRITRDGGPWHEGFEARVG
ncbi:hypothetical protein ACFWXO_16465 [Kitasatospora sp. NPDC059088]|uniref:hypothetical protein n=1 Tax=Kitasatospora sp. NPDC059088 TaxID=3346722 RepID=UPI00369B25EA